MRHLIVTSVSLLFALAPDVRASALYQQEQPDSVRQDSVAVFNIRPHRLTPIMVTATRTFKDMFETPQPASAIGSVTIRDEAPNTVTDLFSALPGLDATGVGPTQVRPAIRGLRGQRILLLADGLRLNNSRRQQDFGEIPALVDVTTLDRVEIVRGPASVLYGSDAIGGVVNLITRTPTAEGLHGSLGYRYSTHDDQQKVTGMIAGRTGRLGFQVHGTFRDAETYSAPAGSFGNITLARDTSVFDTGVQDESFNGYMDYDVTPHQRAFVRVERYRADTTGFGYVDPAAYAPNQPLIQIRYPFQRFDKLTMGYQASQLGLPIADGVNVIGYYQDNERQFDLDVFIPFGPGTPPGAGVQVNSENFTDLETVGVRIDATKLATARVLLTYGVDVFRDDSKNTDASRSTVFGFGPPMTETSARPQVPNATYRSIGTFLQADVELHERASLVLGVRYQDIHAETRPTEGLTAPLVSETDRTAVGSANAIVRVTENLSVIGSVGRAFRSPNLVERFFNGLTPEGGAFQAPNPRLEPETSLNLDFGVRYRDALLYLEGFVFRNEIRDGIRIAPRGDEINGLPVFHNINVDKLRFTGVELSGDIMLPNGLFLGSNYTHLSSKDVLDPSNPVGESFSDKVNAHLGYRHPSDRVWIEYRVRHNGKRKDVDLGTNPVGDVLPAFTVHSARGGVTVFRRGSHTHRVGITVSNLTNQLYAEFANVSFFRPEPRRRVTLTWDMSF